MAARIDLFYGPSGSGKSTGIVAIIKAAFKENGKPWRILVGDGSAATYADAGLIDAGVVELADYSVRDWPLTTFKALCQGSWPREVEDPASPLAPMTPADFKKYGGYAIEGLAVAGQYIMGDHVKGGLAYQSARGVKIGQDSPMKLVDSDYNEKTGLPIGGTGTGEVFGGNPVAHYGFGQRQLMSAFERSKKLPGWVIWTTHERSAEDKLSKNIIIGPEGLGEALTTNLSRHFGNTLHFTTAAKVEKQLDAHTAKQIGVLDSEYRIYTRDHFHPEGTTMVKYRAVTRFPQGADATKLKLYYESDQPGVAVLDLYRTIADAKREAIEQLKGGAT